jgi:hypothetical protein
MGRLIATMLAACVLLTGCVDPAQIAATADIGPRPDNAQAEQIIRTYQQGREMLIFPRGEPDIIRITRAASRGYIQSSKSGLSVGWMVCADLLFYSRDRKTMHVHPAVYIIRDGEVTRRGHNLVNEPCGPMKFRTENVTS